MRPDRPLADRSLAHLAHMLRRIGLQAHIDEQSQSVHGQGYLQGTAQGSLQSCHIVVDASLDALRLAEVDQLPVTEHDAIVLRDPCQYDDKVLQDRLHDHLTQFLQSDVLAAAATRNWSVRAVAPHLQHLHLDAHNHFQHDLHHAGTEYAESDDAASVLSGADPSPWDAYNNDTMMSFMDDTPRPLLGDDAADGRAIVDDGLLDGLLDDVEYEDELAEDEIAEDEMVEEHKSPPDRASARMQNHGHNDMQHDSRENGDFINDFDDGIADLSEDRSPLNQTKTTSPTSVLQALREKEKNLLEELAVVRSAIAQLEQEIAQHDDDQGDDILQTPQNSAAPHSVEVALSPSLSPSLPPSLPQSLPTRGLYAHSNDASPIDARSDDGAFVEHTVNWQALQVAKPVPTMMRERSAILMSVPDGVPADDEDFATQHAPQEPIVEDPSIPDVLPQFAAKEDLPPLHTTHSRDDDLNPHQFSQVLGDLNQQYDLSSSLAASLNNPLDDALLPSPTLTLPKPPKHFFQRLSAQIPDDKAAPAALAASQANPSTSHNAHPNAHPNANSAESPDESFAHDSDLIPDAFRSSDDAEAKSEARLDLKAETPVANTATVVTQVPQHLPLHILLVVEEESALQRLGKQLSKRLDNLTPLNEPPAATELQSLVEKAGIFHAVVFVRPTPDASMHQALHDIAALQPKPSCLVVSSAAMFDTLHGVDRRIPLGKRAAEVADDILYALIHVAMTHAAFAETH